MTKKEHAALRKIQRVTQHPIIPKELIGNHADFNLGWAKCHTYVKEWIDFLLRASPSELHQYLRSPERR